MLPLTGLLGFKAACEKEGIKCEIRSLSIGDFMWISKTQDPPMYVSSTIAMVHHRYHPTHPPTARDALAPSTGHE